MKLFYSPGACSLSVRILLHEFDIPCEFVKVNLKTKETETGENFFDINPKGQVPTLCLNNKEILTENIAIQQYLAETNQAGNLFPPPSNFLRYRILEWISFIASDLHKNFGPFFNANIPADIKKDIFIPTLKKKLDYVAKHLKGKKFLMGDQFTLPDPYLFVILSWLSHAKMELSDWPSLLDYFNRIKQRDSVQKALKEEGLNY